ncbi:hypothetical protein [Mucilaginibacter jinjuensis]|uniref:PKD domain-containing protein n=1 Tax=Mucilaginibacter jinjuensis TaxID=1176721 RepID=A0ABY7T3J9_9SPHI|nr:hypothetical protein [Mucilaginibacter jinjuensis]WCT10373.1 hypothetical protein PQO05_16685 [Mucilaginibacter jinjuensis]
MLPSNDNYPVFQPDQMLTSDNLNDLFGYLEEQGRLTRTNLIGMGIVCGLEVTTSADGKSITISKGCGITSEGYLVSVPEVTYTYYKLYDATQQLQYDRFINGEGKQPYTLYALKQDAAEEDTIALSSLNLNAKVVLIFVEILEVGAKNCNPDSCDDKGVNATVNFVPMLIDQANADLLGDVAPVDLSAPKTSKKPTLVSANNNYVSLAEIRMKRVDIPASTLSTASAIFLAYLNVLSTAFLSSLETTLNNLYTTFSPLVIDIYPDNPFAGLADSFAFLHTNDLTSDQLTSIQYFYDLFSDVLLAYDEFRKTGIHVISDCCSTDDLFPRHLLLSLAITSASPDKLTYRNYFVSSPILQGCCSSTLTELRSLFTRIVLLLEKFTITPQTQVTIPPRRFFDTKILLRSKGPVIRITPSKFGEVPLSKKAIPYYYNVTDGPEQLYTYWNYGKTLYNKQSQNLSYHAIEYNAADDFVRAPLSYDLEEYNFLRIEGHIGMPYTTALQSIQDLKNQNRLPFQILALSGDINQLKQQINNLTTTNSAAGLADSLNIDPDDVTCQFQDMEALYDALSAELITKLCMEMEYLYNQDGNSKLPAPASTVPQVPLLKDNDAAFRFVPDSFGHLFENYYATIKNQAYISADVFLGTFNYFNIADIGDQRFVRAPQNNNTTGFALLYHMEKLYEALTPDLTDFDINVFDTRYDDFMKVANEVKSIVQGDLDNTMASTTNAAGVVTPGAADADTMQQEDLVDHIDDLTYMCKKPQFDALYKDYISRWLNVLMLQRFGYFITKHPGISHKAGVTVGGTFIIVYHEQTTADTTATNPTTGATLTTGFSLSDIDKLTQTGRVGSGIVAGLKDKGGIVMTDTNLNLGAIATKKGAVTAKEETPAPKLTPKMKMRAADTTSDIEGTVEASAPVATDPAKLGIQEATINLQRTGLSSIFTGTFKNTIEGLLTPIVLPPIATQNLDDIITDIADGTVIADFYLPYLCYSDCPPVNFIINTPAPPPVVVPDPTITIEPVAYCINDTTGYKFTVTPTGGQVTGEGVTNNLFIPSAVKIDDGAAKKDITITYTANNKTATTVVTIYAMPIASFTFTPNPSTPLVIQFNNTSAFSDGFSWNINGTAYPDENPSVTFSGDGNYTATLTVTNGPCTSAPVSQSVVIQTTPPVDPTKIKCLSLADLVKTYQTFDADERTIPLKNAKTYPSYAGISDLFAQIDKNQIAGKSASVQQKFFTGFTFNNLGLADLLPQWIRALDGLIQSSNISVQAITLFRYLTDITLYISCIQPEDLGKEKIDMQAALDTIGRQLSAYVKMYGGSDDDDHANVLNNVQVDLKQEVERISQPDTPVYFNAINNLLGSWGGK